MHIILLGLQVLLYFWYVFIIILSIALILSIFLPFTKYILTGLDLLYLEPLIISFEIYPSTDIKSLLKEKLSNLSVKFFPKITSNRPKKELLLSFVEMINLFSPFNCE